VCVQLLPRASAVAARHAAAGQRRGGERELSERTKLDGKFSGAERDRD
jgi:hypothetical protein